MVSPRVLSRLFVPAARLAAKVSVEAQSKVAKEAPRFWQIFARRFHSNARSLPSSVPRAPLRPRVHKVAVKPLPAIAYFAREEVRNRTLPPLYPIVAILSFFGWYQESQCEAPAVGSSVEEVVANKLGISKEDCFKSVYKLAKSGQWGKIETIRKELNELKNEYGRTVLLQAVCDLDYGVVSGLLERRIGHHGTDDEGNTALHLAARYGPVKMLDLCMQKSVINRETPNYANQRPLHVAVISGNTLAAKLLVGEGASLTALGESESSADGRKMQLTPLGFALLQGNTELFDEVFSLISDDETKVKNALKIEGFGTLLHLCVDLGDPILLRHLLEAHHDVFSKVLETSNSEHLSPLAYAVKRGMLEAIYVLHEKGAHLGDPYPPNDIKLVHIAAENFQFKVLHALAYLGVNLQDTDCNMANAAGYLKAKYPNDNDALDVVNHIANLLQQQANNQLKKPDFRMYPPENLVFQGGGAAGIAYVGAIKEMENKLERSLSKVKRVAGTSSGAITAAFVALGYEGKELEKKLSEANFSTFFKHVFNDPEEAYRAIEAVLNKYKSKFWANPLNPMGLMKDFISEASQIQGLCDGKNLREWFEEAIREKTGVEHLTFGELREKFVKKGKAKHLYIYAVPISKSGESGEPICFNSEDGQYDNVIISDALRASTSIPLAFSPHTIHIKINGKRVPDPTADKLVDGGLIRSFPVDAFDRRKFQTNQYLPPDARDFGIMNTRTLGFKLESPKVEHGESSYDDTIISLIKAVIDVYYNAEDHLMESNKWNQHRTIKIKNLGIAALDTNLTEKQKKELYAAGKEGVDSFFLTH